MSRLRFLLAAILAVWFAPFLTTAAFADEISDLNDMYETMVAAEAILLDERQAAEDSLALPDGILIKQPDGSIIALSRVDLRDGLGMGFDIAQDLQLLDALGPYLPDELRSILELGMQSGFGRAEAVNRSMDGLLAEQDRLRGALRRQLSEIDSLLDYVRTKAASAIAERDARIAARDAAGVIDGSVCLDDTVAMDGEATVASIGYGGGKHKVKGAFICLSPNSFLWDSGATVREFRCSGWDLNPANCSLYSEMRYTVDDDPESGHTIYRLEDQRTHIAFHFK